MAGKPLTRAHKATILHTFGVQESFTQHACITAQQNHISEKKDVAGSIPHAVLPAEAHFSGRFSRSYVVQGGHGKMSDRMLPGGPHGKVLGLEYFNVKGRGP